MASFHPHDPTARVLVETADGLAYHRSPTAPAGCVLLVSPDTLEPLMVDFGDGWDLPLRETFELMIADGALRIVFDEHAFPDGYAVPSIDAGGYDISVPTTTHVPPRRRRRVADGRPASASPRGCAPIAIA